MYVHGNTFVVVMFALASLRQSSAICHIWSVRSASKGCSLLDEAWRCTRYLVSPASNAANERPVTTCSKWLGHEANIELTSSSSVTPHHLSLFSLPQVRALHNCLRATDPSTSYRTSMQRPAILSSYLLLNVAVGELPST